MSTYFLSPDGQTQEGPFTLDQVRERFAAGRMTRGTLAWREGLPNWSPVAQVPELASLFAAPPTPAPPPAPRPASPPPPAPISHGTLPVEPQPQPFRTFAPPQAPGPLVSPIAASQPDGLAIASLILGILSILASCMHILSLPLSIAGLVCGLTSKTKVSVRTAGLWTSGIGMGVAILWFIAVILIGVFG